MKKYIFIYEKCLYNFVCTILRFSKATKILENNLI